MAVRSATFHLSEVSHLHHQILVKGNVFEAELPLPEKQWKEGDQITISKVLIELYEITNLNQDVILYFLLNGKPRSLGEHGSVNSLKQGSVTHLKNTHCRESIAPTDYPCPQ